LSKNKWGVDICLFIAIVIIHMRFSIINNGRGVETDPRGILFGGLSKQLGGSTPGNSNTAYESVLLATAETFQVKREERIGTIDGLGREGEDEDGKE
jgi:hypothetical protein